MAKAPREVIAEIETLNPEGLGVSHPEALGGERQLLVRNALPGEAVQARILKRRRGVLYGDGVEVVGDSAHADRTASSCAYFPRCGGCSLHHLDHAAQLAHKEAQLAEHLASLGVDVGSWLRPVSVTRLGYRRKARLGVRRIGEDVLIGFRESFSNRVARMQSCAVLTPSAAALLAPLQRLLGGLSIAGQIPQVELAQGERELVLMLRHLAPLDSADMAALTLFERQHNVTLLLQSGGYDTLCTLAGEPPGKLNYTLAEYGLNMQFGPAQFTQVNHAMNQALIRTVVSYLGGYKSRKMVSRRIADLFCGIGNISLPLARAGARVVGLELAADAIDMAHDNAARNGVSDRASFAVADLYGEDCGIPDDVDTLVLDPPRSGAGPNLAAWLAAFSGADVVYVSCNPATFATDAVCLSEAGFELRQVGVYDMFPHTAHVETIGHFLRRQ